MDDVNTNGFQILHTDDSPDYRRFATLEFGRFGLAINSFATNEEAFVDAKRAFNEGKPYNAVVADYHTESNMRGGDLLVKLAFDNEHGCAITGDILIISSSAERKLLSREINDRIDSTRTSETTNRPNIQIFDKLTERGLVALYCALKLNFPEESKGLNRELLIRGLGYELDRYGEVKEMFEISDHINEIASTLKRGEITLQDIFDGVKKVLPTSFEGKPPQKEM